MSGGSCTGRHAPPNQQGCAQAGADPTLLQCDWLRLDCYRLDRSITGPGSTVTHKGSQRESPLKRLHELCETCHSKPVFHYTAVKYLRRFLILALQLDRNAPCEWAADGVVTEGLVKIQSTRKWKQSKCTTNRSTIEQF